MLERARMQVLSLAPVLFLAALPSRAGTVEPSPAFSLSLSPCPGPVATYPGGPWEREIGGILTTAENPDPELGAAVTLPPEGAASIARIKVAGTAPAEDGGTARVRVYFLDGCRGDGGPVPNIIVWNGAGWQPATEGCELDVTAIEPRFRRGDGAVNITDAIAILGCKFSGDRCPTCRDAADVNDDGTDNITNPIRLLNHLFIGDGPPPFPGPLECGIDPTPDALAPCIHERCEG